MPPTRSPNTRPSSSTPSDCSTASRSAAAPAAERRSSPWSRRAGWHSGASASPWSATRTASRPTSSASPPPGRAASDPATSASSTPSACSGERPQGPDESLRTEETVQFWEHDLPLQMAELATQLEPGHRFDSIVVDEAQDFADSWWEPLLIALKDPDEGGLYVFTDEGPARLQPVRLAAGAAGTADPRPQPAQHPPDRQRLPAARRPPDAVPRRRGAGRRRSSPAAARTR